LHFRNIFDVTQWHFLSTETEQIHRSRNGQAERISVCGDGIVENDEICDGNIVQCSSISSSYIGGIASCNSACDGYNESVCETDG
jgi:hypothetical protein